MKSKSPNNLSVPKASAGDVGYAVAKAAIGSIPVLGAAGSEIFSHLLSRPLEKRRDSWMEEVAERLRQLEAKGNLSIESITENEAFIDALLAASHSAIATHREEKRQALLNAVLNVGLEIEPDEARQMMFLRWIEEFTPWHLKLLKLFNDPLAAYRQNSKTPPDQTMGGLDDVISDIFPELDKERELYDQVWRDLHQRGLVTVDHLHSIMTGNGLYSSRTTDLGKRFVRFITEDTDQ